MRVPLPSTRVFALVAVAVIVAMQVFSLTAVGIFGPEPGAAVRMGVKIAFFTLTLILVYAAGALMVRLLVRMVLKLGIVQPGAALARPVVGDRLILALWSIWTLGLAVALPFMSRALF